MKPDRLLKWFLFGYLGLVFVFIFSPILFSIIFSFNSDRVSNHTARVGLL